MKTTAQLPSRVAASATAALLAVVATYALLRGFTVLTETEADPALVSASARIPMFWRLGIGAYAGGFVAILVFFLGARDPQKVLCVVLAAITPVALLIALQGLFLP